MKFSDYQVATRATAIYPEVGTGSQLALAYVGLGLGEAGEIQGKIKKIIRDDAGLLTEERILGIQAEMGDALWYLARLADELGIDLDTVAGENIGKLLSRQARGVLRGSGDDR